MLWFKCSYQWQTFTIHILFISLALINSIWWEIVFSVHVTPMHVQRSQTPSFHLSDWQGWGCSRKYLSCFRRGLCMRVTCCVSSVSVSTVKRGVIEWSRPRSFLSLGASWRGHVWAGIRRRVRGGSSHVTIHAQHMTEELWMGVG